MMLFGNISTNLKDRLTYLADGILWTIIYLVKMIWKHIKADNFFREYLPNIKSYKHKIRGKNGRGNPIKFSPEETKQIKQALSMLFKDLERSIK
jgi:hypothetical protein